MDLVKTLEAIKASSQYDAGGASVMSDIAGESIFSLLVKFNS